jgi:hypothetical protein
MILKQFSAVAVLLAVAGSSGFAQGGGAAVMPHVIVYKTKNDYHKLVPIVLTEGQMSIESYPDPKDFVASNNYLYPLALHKGYWLDRRGIDTNTVYLNITGKQYSKLDGPPFQKEMMTMVKDRDPLTELYDCGPKSAANSIAKLNKLIDRRLLNKKCKKIK